MNVWNVLKIFFQIVNCFHFVSHSMCFIQLNENKVGYIMSVVTFNEKKVKKIKVCKNVLFPVQEILA